jgi:hypothetical protein
MAAVAVKCNAHAVAPCIGGVVRKVAGAHEFRDVRAIEIGAHHAHAFAITPIEMAVDFVEHDLLGRSCLPRRHQHAMFAAVELGAFDRAVVRGNCARCRVAVDQMDAGPHIGPVHDLLFGIDLDAVGRARQVREHEFMGSVRR